MMARADTRVWVMRIAIALVPFVAIAALWHFGDLSSLRSADEVGSLVRAVGEGRLGFVYVPVGIAVGTLIFVPVNALIAGTTLAFDPLRGFVYAMAGALLGAALAYGIGSLLGRSMLDRFNGPRLTRLRKLVSAHAFRSALIVRLLPFGSFTVVNLLAGSLRMPFGGFILGSAVGLLPGILVLTFLSDHVPEVLRSPSPQNVALLAAAVAVIVGVGWLLKRWARRIESGA